MRADRSPVSRPQRLPSRPTDRIEDAAAWLLTAAALLLAVAAGVAGFTVHNRSVERAVVENATRWPVSAVLLEDAVVPGPNGEPLLPVQVIAGWTDRDGIEHTGPISVRRPAVAGSAVQVWVDADGQSVDEPAQPLGAVLAGAGAAAGVLTAGARSCTCCGLRCGRSPVP